MRYLAELFQALLFAGLIASPFALYFWNLTP